MYTLYTRYFCFPLNILTPIRTYVMGGPENGFTFIQSDNEVTSEGNSQDSCSEISGDV